jgi:putative peptide zinc metalloprotease protein
MYVELNLAALATWLWWFSEPGLVNHLALNVMFVSSVSTLLFNGNPLLRYDGYYILSDLLEIPNLRQKASATLHWSLARWLLGVTPRHDPFLPTRRQWAFAFYAIASSIYGWLVSLSIFWFLYHVLAPHGLAIVGRLLGLAMVVSLIVVPLVRFGRFLLQPARVHSMNKVRAAVGFAVVGGLFAAVLAVPLPYYVSCPVEISPRGATNVYVDVPGQVRTVYVRSGPVAAGQPIVELDDVEARLAEQRLAGQRDQLATRVESIRQRAHTDDQALLELAQAEEGLNALELQLTRRREELARLVVRAPVAGELLPAPGKPRPQSGRANLASWSGRPLEVRNAGAHLEASTLLGRITQPGELEAILALPQ